MVFFAIIAFLVILFLLFLFLFLWVIKSTNSQNQSESYQFDSPSKSEAVIISCYFNPQKNPYRRTAFNRFYDGIKRFDHRIIECVIGDSQPELPENNNIQRVYAKNLLWHKEALLNKIIADLPANYKYVFWVDADVIFENDNWLSEGVNALQTHKIIQPFEYCVHLERDQTSFFGNPVEINRETKNRILAGESLDEIRVWKSFGATYCENPQSISHYDLHGHVGFAWGARREILAKVPLYDRALIGGADHIIAHAAVGQIPHECITKAFAENIDEINDWSRRFFAAVGGANQIGFVRGTLLHLWHGDLKKRDYLNRIRVNTPRINNIRRRDENGLYETDDDSFVGQYFETREVRENDETDYFDNSDSNYDYSSASESNDYFQSRSVDFVGAGTGGSWEDSSSSNLEAESSLSAELSTFEGSTFS